jgi:hypothetical protein
MIIEISRLDNPNSVEISSTDISSGISIESPSGEPGSIEIQNTGSILPQVSTFTIETRSSVFLEESKALIEIENTGSIDPTIIQVSTRGLPGPPGSGSGAVMTTPDISNLNMPTANTEYTFPLPAGTKQFEIRSRALGKLQLAFIEGESGSTFVTVWPGNSYREIGLLLSDVLDVYIQSSRPDDILEILSWT